MSERKVLNKYFPANFDPALIPRRKMGKDRQQVVRLMAPFSMRCNTCDFWVPKAKKFNARKETVQGEEYYGIKIFRFYIKCPSCSAEITFKTDPKNTDYAAEHGATRNFEPWRDDSETADSDKLDALEAQEQAELNPMEELESKTASSKNEMEILDALHELKTRNARLERAAKGEVGPVLDRVSSGIEVGDRDIRVKLTEYELERKKEAEEDEEEIRRVFRRAYVGGVPDITLEEDVESSDDGSEFSTPRTDTDDDAPVASGSGSKAARPPPATASIKRKLDIVEPTPASLLSAASRSIVEKSSGTMGPPPKKKKGNSALAKMLGIKLKGK